MTQEPVIISDKAAEKIIEKTELNSDAVGLRLTVKTTGCSGNSYQMEHVLEEDLSKDDRFEKEGAVLYIPKMHSWMLFGTQIDYEDGDMSSGFTFTNPNEAGRCGCGESFTVDRPDK
ncbi:MAG: iron-sulfur cluster assembly accessory protein [Alphaproteobacteria bacterium]|nr:iron-sulfur cluster assembly accessory protein [Alphaproteobacteria bacterium]